MKLLISLLLTAAACFAQGHQNVVQTGTVDARGVVWKAPSATFAAAPAHVAGAVYVFTDASADGTCGGGGSAKALCYDTGSVWLAIGGGGGGGGGSQPNIWPSGTIVQKYVQCAYGTTSYTAVAALGAVTTGEITIQTAVSGNLRYEHVQVSETTLFAGTFTALTVSMGRPGPTQNSEFTGVPVALKQSSSDQNYWNARPTPPVLGAGTYNIVLNFTSTGANLSTASAGVLTWELCGYDAR